MKICFVGYDNLPVLAREYRQHTIGGESVQQTLLARALARRGHQVTMVVADYGQEDGAAWDGIRTLRSYRPDAGVPGLRFIHPRWSKTWSALSRADADIYYTSCAGMQVGLVALFCKLHGRRFVFRAASDSDCDRSKLLVRYARDRWLYSEGLRRADAILLQSSAQAEALARNFGLAGRVAGMLVEMQPAAPQRDIDVLWVNNIRRLKQPGRVLELARRLPQAQVHMAGGALPGEEALFEEVRRAATAYPNIQFHGRVSYWEANELYGRAKLLLNTSDIEGFPNAYLQAWARGVPVVTLIDPDGIIRREGLGAAVPSAGKIPEAVRRLLHDGAAWSETSRRCRRFIEREYGEEQVLDVYLDTFRRLHV
jgi:glycosyltransferase involved in cell wall biosynthesis